MDATVLQSRSNTMTSGMSGNAFGGGGGGGGGGAGSGGGYVELETPSVEYPSTPLGAALGPAAAAAIVPRPNATFMSRYDQYASASNRRY